MGMRARKEMAKAAVRKVATRGRGRPPKVATEANTKRAEELIAVGMSETDIAASFGIARETARRIYGEAFRHGRARRRAEVIHTLFDLARKGNVSAAKHLESMTGMASAEAAFEAASVPEEKPKKLGKKEQAQKDAQTAEQGTAWASLLN
jgi:hypothetical protein